jgi:hypothetical protein
MTPMRSSSFTQRFCQEEPKMKSLAIQEVVKLEVVVIAVFVDPTSKPD